MVSKQQIQSTHQPTNSLDRFALSFEYNKTLQEIKREIDAPNPDRSSIARALKALRIAVATICGAAVIGASGAIGDHFAKVIIERANAIERVIDAGENWLEALARSRPKGSWSE